MGLFIVEVKAGEWKGTPIVRASLQAGALLEVTADFIPVASDLERRVADRLIAEGRAFNKPLRFNAGVDLVLPEFMLTDTGVASGCPMEVFGRDDVDYRARQAEKEAYYRDAYGMARLVAVGSRRPQPHGHADAADPGISTFAKR